MKPAFRFLALTIAVAAAAACGDDGKKPASGGGGGEKAPAASGGGDKAAPAAGTKYDKAKGTGGLKGVVKYKGTPPAAKMNGQGSGSDAFCKGVGDQVLEATETNKDGSVPHVFVYASDGPHKGMTGFEAQAVTIDQKGCVYVPHVTGVLVGQNVTIKTSDNTTHNVKASPNRNKAFNLMQPPGKTDTVVFDKKEAAVKLQCDIHSWMSGYVFAMDHPFHATSARDSGAFEIKGLVPGKYKFKAWHETFAKEGGGKEYEVEIQDGKTAELTIELGQ